MLISGLYVLEVRGFINLSSQRIRLALTDTQPAVAPLPFACRKIALPLPRTTGSWL